MFKKLGIIVLVIVGVAIISTEIGYTFLDSSPISTLKTHLDGLVTQTTASAEQGINVIVNKTSNESITGTINQTTNTVTEKLSNASTSTQNVITESFSDFDPLKSIQSIIPENIFP